MIGTRAASRRLVTSAASTPWRLAGRSGTSADATSWCQRSRSGTGSAGRDRCRGPGRERAYLFLAEDHHRGSFGQIADQPPDLGQRHVGGVGVERRVETSCRGRRRPRAGRGTAGPKAEVRSGKHRLDREGNVGGQAVRPLPEEPRQLDDKQRVAARSLGDQPRRVRRTSSSGDRADLSPPTSASLRGLQGQAMRVPHQGSSEIGCCSPREVVIAGGGEHDNTVRLEGRCRRPRAAPRRTDRRRGDRPGRAGTSPRRRPPRGSPTRRRTAADAPHRKLLLRRAGAVAHRRDRRRTGAPSDARGGSRSRRPPPALGPPVATGAATLRRAPRTSSRPPGSRPPGRRPPPRARVLPMPAGPVIRTKPPRDQWRSSSRDATSTRAALRPTSDDPPTPHSAMPHFTTGPPPPREHGEDRRERFRGPASGVCYSWFAVTRAAGDPR